MPVPGGFGLEPAPAVILIDSICRASRPRSPFPESALVLTLQMAKPWGGGIIACWGGRTILSARVELSSRVQDIVGRFRGGEGRWRWSRYRHEISGASRMEEGEGGCAASGSNPVFACLCSALEVEGIDRPVKFTNEVSRAQESESVVVPRGCRGRCRSPITVPRRAESHAIVDPVRVELHSAKKKTKGNTPLAICDIPMGCVCICSEGNVVLLLLAAWGGRVVHLATPDTGYFAHAWRGRRGQVWYLVDWWAVEMGNSRMGKGGRFDRDSYWSAQERQLGRVIGADQL